MKFHLYRYRPGARIKVPLATPEIVEFNESIINPYSIQQRNDTSLVITYKIHNNIDDVYPVETSSSSPPTAYQHGNTIDESITDSSKQIRSYSIR